MTEIQSPLEAQLNEKENELRRKEHSSDLYRFLRTFDLKNIKHDVSILEGEPYVEILEAISRGEAMKRNFKNRWL